MLSKPILSSPLPHSLPLRRRKGKLIAKRDGNLFSYWLGGQLGARMEEDSCGGRLADPLPSASPVPRCTESVTKQASRNTGQTLRASHWDEHYLLSAQ